jgi:Tfp pilus assembly protein PilW
MNTNKKSGYSLVEIIVYLAIFTAISILVINSFIIILSSFETTNMNRKLLESGVVSMERISREIRQAQNVDPSSTSTILVLNSTDSSEDPMVVKFLNEGGLLNIYKNNNEDPEGNLLGQNISVTSLVFRHITTTESEAVKIEMTLQYSMGNNTKSENFYDTIILRGGY